MYMSSQKLDALISNLFKIEENHVIGFSDSQIKILREGTLKNPSYWTINENYTKVKSFMAVKHMTRCTAIHPQTKEFHFLVTKILMTASMNFLHNFWLLHTNIYMHDMLV